MGIDNSAGHDGVTIKNGAVRNFTNGVVLLEHATGNRVQRLKLVSDNSTGAADNGILIFDSDHNRIEHNSISGSFNGILLGNTTNSIVERNRVSGVHDGIFLFDADRNVVKRNALSDLLATGILVLGGADNVISGTRCAHAGRRGRSRAVYGRRDRRQHDGTGNVFARNSMVANLFGSPIRGDACRLSATGDGGAAQSETRLTRFSGSAC